MIPREVFEAAPDADRLLALTSNELKLLLLRFVRAAGDDQLRVMVSCDGTISELFGPGNYDRGRLKPVTRAITDAWRELEDLALIEEPDPTNGKNGYRVISDKGRAVSTDIDLSAVQVRMWLTPEMVHHALHGAALNAFRGADYDTAVFEAFKAVEAAVKTKGGFGTSDFGVALMRKAYDPHSGPLTDGSASIGGRTARRDLFMGAMGEFRNASAHGVPIITDPLVAIERIMTASNLLRIVGI